MKIRITTLFANGITKILSNNQSIKLEKKIDMIQTVVNRNKLVFGKNESIDGVISCVKNKKIKYKVYY